MDFSAYKSAIEEKGFTIINNVLTAEEIAAISTQIEEAIGGSENFRKTADLFAIRQLFKELPQLKTALLDTKLLQIVRSLFGPDYFLVKAIYFDKPPLSNWFVSYHQDLSIAVDKKAALEGFGQWTVKSTHFGVQPPVPILESMFTIRIHLDECTADNGALHVIPGSHKNGICRNISSAIPATICEVEKGGIMIMKPLLMHASHKSVVEQHRRVVHLEFSNQPLPQPIQWLEKENLIHDAS